MLKKKKKKKGNRSVETFTGVDIAYAGEATEESSNMNCLQEGELGGGGGGAQEGKGGF